MACEIVSYGGGVNSTAMLVGMWERDWKPSAILFADTGGENPETYEFVARFSSWLKERRMPKLTVVHRNSERHASLEEECHNNGTLPSKAYGNAGCSVKWKRQPMDRWISCFAEANAAWLAGERVVRLIGIDAGEQHRGQIPETERFRYRYPLIEWGWGREECLDAIRRSGLPAPMKSACFFCPAMRKAEVIRLANVHPDLFKRAIAIERAASPNNGPRMHGLGRHWSWEALAAADRAQLKLFPDVNMDIACLCFDGEESRDGD